MGRAERKARRPQRKARPFRRGLFGYRARQVDARLAALDATIAELRVAVDAASSSDHRDLVERATRRSALRMLEATREEADALRAAARSEADAMLADAYELVRARDESVDLKRGPHDPGVVSPGPGDT